jgi:hypothetical protein
VRSGSYTRGPTTKKGWFPVSGNIIQPGWTAFYAKQQQARKALDTFDADMVELHDIAERLYTLIAHTEDIDFARTLLANNNIGCGITVPM